MATVNGKLGTVIVNTDQGPGEPNNVTKWMFEPSVNIPKWASNSSGGHKDASCGPIDSKGSFETKFDPTQGVIAGVGDEISLQLVSDKNSPTNAITLTAIISTTPVEVDIDGGVPETIKYSFETKGAYTGTGAFANL